MSCPSDNTASEDQSSFWNGTSVNWDSHRIGWVIAGACAVVTVLVSIITVLLHCRNYNNRREQRQVIRILWMPPVYAIISFFSYRFFRTYTYYALVEAAYEAITISAFMLLLVEYVAATASNQQIEKALERKDKRKLPFPFCCWRFKPTKAYFMYTIKWTVMQYVIVRPLVSVAGIITQYYNVLCESIGFTWQAAHFANIYLEAVDFVSISVALYGLIVFYVLVREELSSRKPLAKFLAIKLIVMATFYQSFIFTALEGRVLKATEYWTTTNIADGLNALAICIEMVFFAIFMGWAYTYREYRIEGAKKTSIWRPLWDALNISDFALEIWSSLVFFWDYLRGKPHAHGELNKKKDFGEAFHIEGYDGKGDSAMTPIQMHNARPGSAAAISDKVTKSRNGVKHIPSGFGESPNYTNERLPVRESMGPDSIGYAM